MKTYDQIHMSVSDSQESSKVSVSKFQKLRWLPNLPEGPRKKLNTLKYKLSCLKFRLITC